MNKKELLQRIIKGSVRYEMLENGNMEIKSYYGGETIIINLNEVSEDALLTEEEYEEQMEESEEW